MRFSNPVRLRKRVQYLQRHPRHRRDLWRLLASSLARLSLKLERGLAYLLGIFSVVSSGESCRFTTGHSGNATRKKCSMHLNVLLNTLNAIWKAFRRGRTKHTNRRVHQDRYGLLLLGTATFEQLRFRRRQVLAAI